MATTSHTISATQHDKRPRTTITSLPTELIALIAIQGDTKSLLCLSRTSSLIRAAVFNTSVVRELLFSDHADDRSADTSWDTPALIHRAGSDVNVWLRYSLAVERANELLRLDRLAANEAFTWSDWIAELAVLRHPFFYNPGCIANHEHTSTAESSFAILLSELCAIELLSRKSEGQHGEPSHLPTLFTYADLGSFTRVARSQTDILRLTCMLMALISRRQLLRQRVWPYGNHDIVPDIIHPLPSKMQLYSAGSSDPALDLPVPYSRHFGLSSTQSWSAWYDKRCEALPLSSDFLFTGTWQGYYSVTDQMPDPPMIDIVFRRGAPHRHAQLNGDGDATVFTQIYAQDCRDAIGPFSLHGVVEKLSDNNDVRIIMEKRYSGGLRWTWNCAVTPFGIVGHWNDYGAPRNNHQHGALWLWKREWC